MSRILRMARVMLVVSGTLWTSWCSAAEPGAAGSEASSFAAALQSQRMGAGADEALNYKIAADDCLRQGLISESIAKYHKSIQINPHCLSAYFNLAIAYYQMRDLEKAALALENLVALKPGDTEAHYNLACLKIYLGDPAGARQHFERAQCGNGFDGRLASLIEQGLEFLAELGGENPSTQDLVLFLIRQGLPPL